MYIKDLKASLNGRALTGIFTMGCIFNNYDNEDDDAWDAEERLSLDEPLVIDFSGLHLDICFHNRSHVKIGLNTLSMQGKSYQGCDWRNVSHHFPELINQTVRDIILETSSEGFYDSVFNTYGDRPDGGDYFNCLFLVLSGGNTIILYGEEEYMEMAVEKTDRLPFILNETQANSMEVAKHADTELDGGGFGQGC